MFAFVKHGLQYMHHICLSMTVLLSNLRQSATVGQVSGKIKESMRTMDRWCVSA